MGMTTWESFIVGTLLILAIVAVVGSCAAREVAIGQLTLILR